MKHLNHLWKDIWRFYTLPKPLCHELTTSGNDKKKKENSRATLILNWRKIVEMKDSLFYWVLGHCEMYLWLSTGSILCLSTACYQMLYDTFKYITNIWLFIPHPSLSPISFDAWHASWFRLWCGCLSKQPLYETQYIILISVGMRFVVNRSLVLPMLCLSDEDGYAQDVEGEWKRGVWRIWPQYQETKIKLPWILAVWRLRSNASFRW